jgi:HEPN domain-containing protein
MPGNEPILAAVREWIERAEEDLMAAGLLLKAGRRPPTNTICFHAQQCVEKYLKAYLAWRSTEFPKTHAIEKLFSLIPTEARPNVGIREQSLISDYGVAPRYPGWTSASLAQARRAVTVARRVRKHVRSLVPRRALLPSKRR